MHPGLPTDEKVRKAIVAAHQQGQTYAQIAALLSVGEATVSRVLRRHRETGGVVPKPRGGGNLSPIRGSVAETFVAIINEQPDMTQAELAEALAQRESVKLSRSSIKRALRRLGFSRKKSSSPP